MAAISVIGDNSTGHGGFPPTKMLTTPITKTKINGKNPGAVDPQCQFATHTLGLSVHPQDIRYPTEGSKKTKIEGYYIARIGDPLADGDVIGKGSENTFVE